MKFPVILMLFVIDRFSTSLCSVGDRSPFYQNCVNTCARKNCLKGRQILDHNKVQMESNVLSVWRKLFSPNGVTFSSSPTIQQDIWSRLLQWSCRDECCYLCMWRTVANFQKVGYDEPKFHGKWPFIRLLGVQEPASAFSSLLNFAANAYMYRKIRREFPMRSSALAFFWHVFAFVCMNAWLWSTVFHTRDKPFTEFMDYACALSMVMGLFFAAVIRVFHRRRRLSALMLVLPLFYFITHVQYLYTGRVDYDYNMKVNVFFGVVGSVLWLAWSAAQHAAGRAHARSMLAFTALNGLALALELLDFPPLWRAWDAHALWHLATAPLPLLFYKFVIDDLRLLQSSQYEKLDFKQT